MARETVEVPLATVKAAAAAADTLTTLHLKAGDVAKAKRADATATKLAAVIRQAKWATITQPEANGDDTPAPAKRGRKATEPKTEGE